VSRLGRAGGLASLLMFALVAIAIPAASARASVAQQSKAPIKARNGWKRDVIDPGRLVYPKAVYVVGESPGNVHDTAGLKAPGGAATTITETGFNAHGVGSPSMILDLGENVGGYVEIGIRSSDGTPIRLGYSESLDYLTPRGDTGNLESGGPRFASGVSDDPEGRTDLFQARTPAQLRSPGIRGAQRFISLQLESPGTAAIDYVRVRTEHLRPGPRRYSGYFLSSDDTLNRIWYATAYTFALDSFRDLRPGYSFSRTVVTDGAKRDRLIWAGDLSMEDLVGNYSLRSAPGIIRDSLLAFSCLQYGDGQLAPATQIAVQCPRRPPPGAADASQFPASAAPIPDSGALRLPQYTAAWVIALRDYYMLTGDKRFTHLMMPVVRRALSYFLANLDSGLYRTPSRNLTINWHPPDVAGGIDTYTNAAVVRALVAGSQLERHVGLGRRWANAWVQHAAAIRGAMLAHLWDPRAGAFIVNTDDPIQNHTEDAQVGSILAGVTAPAQSQQALRFIDSHLMTPVGVVNGEADDPYMSRYISPYISGVELLARMSVGDTTDALNLMRRTWGDMLAHGPGTVWESMQLNGLPKSGGISLAHGWAGGPVPALSGYVLGIRPTAPGYGHWIVAPQPGDLRFAQGEAPTPHGPIASRWRRGGHSIKLTVIAPKGTSGVVKLPLPRHARTIAMDGKVIHAKRRGGAVRLRMRGGQHTFVAG
jgi:alpha-L-rhamnosidase